MIAPMTAARQYRAGQSVEDHCRQCHEDRTHTVIVVDANAHPLRVSCDFCRSEHNYRGGPRLARSANLSAEARSAKVEAPRASGEPRHSQPVPFMSQPDTDLESRIRRIIREESGLTPVAPAAQWLGGLLVLKPGKPGVQDKAWPIEPFFNKVVMLR